MQFLQGFWKEIFHFHLLLFYILYNVYKTTHFEFHGISQPQNLDDNLNPCNTLKFRFNLVTRGAISNMVSNDYMEPFSNVSNYVKKLI